MTDGGNCNTNRNSHNVKNVILQITYELQRENIPNVGYNVGGDFTKGSQSAWENKLT